MTVPEEVSDNITTAADVLGVTYTHVHLVLLEGIHDCGVRLSRVFGG